MFLSDYIIGVQSGHINPREIMNECLAKIKKNELNSWIRDCHEYAESHIDEYKHKALCGAPIGIKDIIMTQGITTTCGSKMLENYIPEYSATCFQKLEQAGGLMIGKNTMDEFAMGGSGEHCAFGPTLNPRDHSRIAGGSSSGSAASVANHECLAALGTDTGGSVRLPAAFCGIVGFKPTYGHISRFGVQSMSNSLDQIGVLAQSVNDAEIVYKQIRGVDAHDMRTISDTSDTLHKGKQGKDLRICVMNEFFQDGIDPLIKQETVSYIDRLKSAGYNITFIDFPWLKYLIATYYIICPAEVSTNVARFDGIRYGLQADTSLFDSVQEYYTHIRSQGFGTEVKRRILTGSHVLSSGYADQYFHKAIKVRDFIRGEYEKLFKQYDIVMGPTSPVWPWKIGGHANDPIAEYLVDAYAVPANLIQAPAISLPIGFGVHEGVKLPIGMQLMAKPGNDELLFIMGKELEKRT
ncbi:MAG TPA: Asp-tRNA(Asn)/Glu-tRNA(Gln) amidotransferase subunit GatA [Candidatus Absconditabacterales bacterium]|nr:Asp-tRNA(Asn)/Glu-tRNA(Gln) amidotransferase subunit GatA [Candidatus Absconditabacterales bacterium]